MTTAAANPNSISCACHSSGAIAIGGLTQPSTIATHSGIDSAANAAAPR